MIVCASKSDDWQVWRKGVYVRDGIAHVRYQDEHGGDVRASTKQPSARVAHDTLAKRNTELREPVEPAEPAAPAEPPLTETYS